MPGPSFIEQRDQMLAACAAQGRDPKTLEISVGLYIKADDAAADAPGLAPTAAALGEAFAAWDEAGVAEVLCWMDPITPARLEVLAAALPRGLTEHRTAGPAVRRNRRRRPAPTSTASSTGDERHHERAGVAVRADQLPGESGTERDAGHRAARQQRHGDAAASGARDAFGQAVRGDEQRRDGECRARAIAIAATASEFDGEQRQRAQPSSTNANTRSRRSSRNRAGSHAVASAARALPTPRTA